MSSSEYSRNILLGSLAPADLALLSPHFEQIELRRGQCLTPSDQPIAHVDFLCDGVASVISRTRVGGMTEVGIFGGEGFGSLAPLLGTRRTPFETLIQSEVGCAYRIAVEPLMAAVEQSAALRTALLRYVQTFLIQTAQSATSNAHQKIEARLARWLLMCHDRLRGDDIFVTHEFIGMMIAAERSSVTLALHVLEGEGMIRSRRGRVTVLDRAGMRGLAGDGYGQAEGEYSRLIAPFGKG